MWCMDAMGYYSAITRNNIGSLVETWMDLGTVIKNEVSQNGNGLWWSKTKEKENIFLCWVEVSI